MGGSRVYKELEEQTLPLYEVKDSKRFIKVILTSSVIMNMRQACLLALCKYLLGSDSGKMAGEYSCMLCRHSPADFSPTPPHFVREQ